MLKNAVEAVTSGGKVQIASRVDPRFVTVEVADDGEGIASADLARVFQPYFSTKDSGHGLGMMIVQRIMNDHGGKISLSSEEGRGTRVSLQFPRQNPERPPLAAAGEGARARCQQPS